MADPTNWTNVGSPTTGTSGVVSPLTPSTQYDVDVVATNSAGSATSAVISGTTLPANSGVGPSAPTGLALSQATTSSITLTWVASASGTAPINYQPQYRITGQSAWNNFGGSVSGTSVTITGLTAGTSYDFQVSATNSTSSALSTTVTGSTAAPLVAPSGPQSLNTSSITMTSMTLSWAASATGTAPIIYQPQYRIAGQIPWTNAGSGGSALSVQISGLAQGTSYELQVVASNTVGNTASSILTTSTLSSGVPAGPPGSMTISSITTNTATLTWLASATGSLPISYQPQYRVSGQTQFIGSGPGNWLNSGSPTTGLTATITGLSPGTTYDFQVVASNTAGSAASTTQTAATTGTASVPTNPGNPTAWIITPTSVSLTWAASTGPAPIVYQIQYRVTGQTAWIPYGSSSTAISGTVTGLTPGTDYDFRVSASNSAGASFSNTLTILAPITGGTVTAAAYQPNQILSAESLDASFDSKLDKTGGTVGPLQQAQTASGGSQPSLLALSRTVGGVSDSPMVSGAYIAVMSDGPVIAYSSIAMTLTVSGDINGNGPAGNIWNILGALNISALRSTIAPATGSQHAAVTAQVQRSLPTAGVPTGRRLSDGWAVYAPVSDNTSLPSSQSGALAGIYSPISVNARDDGDLRYGARIVYGENTPVSSGGLQAEFARGLFVGAGSTTAYAKVILELGGPFENAALDLRGSSAYTATITSSTPSGPVTTISVSKVLPFASAGSPASSVTASNPKAVTINGRPYSVVAVSTTAGLTSGVLTFSSAVPAADAAQGSTVVPVSVHTIWLSEGTTGGLPGDIALNNAGTSRLYYDSSGGGATLATGNDRATFLGTSALRLPVGNSSQRPPSPLFGDLRANTDINTLEIWQPSNSSWVSITSGSTSTGTVPGPALALLAGTPTTSAVGLSWSAPSTGSTPFTYQVQFRVSGVSAWTNWGASQTTTTTTVSGLTDGTRYDFQIITSNSFGSSTSAITSVTILSIIPASPTGLAASAATSTTVTLNWVASASGTAPISYQPQYRITGQTPWNVSPSGATTGTSQTITGLTAATSYDFEIVASNAGGSATSTTVTQATSSAATVAPSAPTAVSATTPTSSSLVVAWTAPGSGTTPFSYQVQFRITGQSTFTSFGGSVTGTSLTVTGLTAATSYDFEVTATNSAGTSTSTIATGTTAAAPIASAGSVAGSQNSGTSSPVIAGPATGAVTTSNVLAVTGITITDPTAATAAGSCSLVLSCSGAGTVSATVGGAQISGSGSKTITYSNTLSACQTAAADLIYSAGASAGTDTITVKLTDQSGSNHSISIPITISLPVSGGGSGGSIPTDSTGTTAVQAQKVLNGFGVNTHLDYAGYQNATLATVENCINYLGGIKLLRDSPGSSSDSTWWAQVAQATNTQFIAYIAISNQSSWAAYMSNASGVPAAYIAAYEGVEEADTGQNAGFSETIAQAASFQQTVWNAGQQAGVPVVQMSFGSIGFNTNPTTGDFGTVGNLSAFATYGNIHLIPSQSPLTGNLLKNYVQNFAPLATPGKPVAITRMNWNQVVGAGYSSCSPQTAAAYVLEMIFDCYLLGCPYYIWDALIDDLTSEFNTSRGLFTDTGTPRPSATAVKNLFSLLLDGSTNAVTFTPGKLNYTLTNFPGVSGGNGGYQVLLQKSDGTFWLALWNEQPLNDTSTGNDLTVSAINITLTLGTTPVSITVYDPSVSATAVESAGAVTSINISLPARVILVKIVHA